MKNTAILVLSLLLVAAIICLLILYPKHSALKEDLLIAQEKLSNLNEKVTQLNRERTGLQAQINENAKSLKELDAAQERIVHFMLVTGTVRQCFQCELHGFADFILATFEAGFRGFE